MEARTTVGWYRVIADERVDGSLLLEGVRWPDALDDQRRDLLSLIQGRRQQDGAAMIADAHTTPLAQAFARGRVRVNANAGARSFAIEVGVSENVVLRKCRAGGHTSL